MLGSGFWGVAPTRVRRRADEKRVFKLTIEPYAPPGKFPLRGMRVANFLLLFATAHGRLNPRAPVSRPTPFLAKRANKAFSDLKTSDSSALSIRYTLE